MKIKELTSYLEQIAPLAYQESYDNCGLLLGDAQSELRGVLVSLDVTEEVVQEAIERGCNLIVAHHPLIFKGLKKITGRNYVERTAILAIKNDIAVYAIHTNLDNVSGGVNYKIAQKLNLSSITVLRTKSQILSKLTVFVPLNDTPKLLAGLHKAGAGEIGNYSDCSFKTNGIGTFRPNDLANPSIGARGALEEVEENRIEVIFPSYLTHKILVSMYENHPYEEVAYYLHTLENNSQDVGSGAVGLLPEEMDVNSFLSYLKRQMELSVIRYTTLPKGKIRKVAVCGGVGSFLLGDAKATGADAFVTADYKYHEFFDAEGEILIADIGHFESEVFTKDLLVEIISKKITNFAPCLSAINTNPVNYFY